MAILDDNVTSDWRRDMADTRWRTLGEAIGLLGLVGSVLFLALQVRQENAVAQVAARSEFVYQEAAWMVAVSTDEHLPTLYRRWIDEGYEAFTAEEQARLNFSVLAVLRIYEAGWRSVGAGLVTDEEIRDLFVLETTVFFESAYFVEHWPILKNDVTADFAQAFETWLPHLAD
jgi:hypothetical protein